MLLSGILFSSLSDLSCFGSSLWVLFVTVIVLLKVKSFVSSVNLILFNLIVPVASFATLFFKVNVNFAITVFALALVVSPNIFLVVGSYDAVQSF